MSKDLIGMKKGLVTMADILGWKGIWREADKSHLDILVNIKKDINQSAFQYSLGTMYSQLEKSYPYLGINKKIIIDSLDHLYDWASKEIIKVEWEKIDLLFIQFVGVGQYDDFFEGLQEKFPKSYNLKHEIKNIIDSFKAYFEKMTGREEIKKLYDLFVSYMNDKNTNSISNILSEYSDTSLRTHTKALFDEYILRIIKTTIMRDVNREIDLIFYNNALDYSVDLLSDTFIICSNCKNEATHLSVHGNICKELIEMCILDKLLIRGATSYGYYRSEESVFIGPAIDEAASWHELAQEVSILLTPSVTINFKNELNNNELFVRREVPFKSKRFSTHCIRWEDSNGQFLKIAKEESPMLPEFADKYTNTLKYLEEGNNEKDKKIDFSVTI